MIRLADGYQGRSVSVPSRSLVVESATFRDGNLADCCNE